MAVAAWGYIPGAVEAQGRSVTLADIAEQVDLAPPAISPDGKRIAVVTSRANFGDNRFATSLVLVDVASGTRREVNTGKIDVGSPRWSPRGDRLAWLGTEEGGTPQLYVMSMTESDVRPRALTHVSQGVRNNAPGIVPFEWSPDGESIAFIAADPKAEAQGEERYNKSFEVADNDYLTTEVRPTFHVWLVSAAGGEPRQLNSGSDSVVGIGWRPSGESIVFSSQPYPHNSDLDFAEFMRASSNSTAIKNIDVASANATLIMPMARILSAPTSSPNGELVAYLHSRGSDPWAHTSNVAVIQRNGGDPHDVTTSLDRNIATFAWLPDSRTLAVTASNGTRIALWLQPIDGPARQLDLGKVVALDGLTVSKSGVIAFVGTEPRHPPELYVMASITSKPRRLTDFNAQLASLKLGSTETITWHLDGFEHTGVLLFPPNYKENQKTPLVLHIHGGPQATSTEAFNLFDQSLASHGWLVFEPNYRGSDPQGDAYQAALIKDPGDGPGRDVMAGIAAVKTRANVDEGRIAVSGWSYGGFMSAWLITHYDVFRAAVIGAPAVDWVDWYDLSCCNAWANPVFGGSPWVNDNLQNYRKWSPVNYAANVKAAVLLLHNLGDPEAPFTQSYHFYQALRDNGVPVKFVAYPLQGHGWETDPVNQRDKFRRWIGWIDEHFAAALP
jgi:dipeptidyl aminopeptidase/acylaminoacyl peptidase